MAKLNRWHDWIVIDEMRPVGQHADSEGQEWADFDMTFRLRWWRFLHPGYWWSMFQDAQKIDTLKSDFVERLAKAVALVGPVDMDDTDDAARAYAEDLARAYWEVGEPVR